MMPPIKKMYTKGEVFSSRPKQHVSLLSVGCGDSVDEDMTLLKIRNPTILLGDSFRHADQGAMKKRGV
tara:strand:+ start:2567 stop:2770 length:204 start_codon:yes stop_codon:yes gene_type:complete